MSRRGDYLTRARRMRRELTERDTRVVLHCSGFGELYPDRSGPLLAPRCKLCGAQDVGPSGFCQPCKRGAP